MIRDGYWIRISERPTSEGGVVGTYADISEIKQRETQRREQELAQQAVLLQITLDNLTQGVVVFDANGQLQGWNQRMLAMLDLTANSIHRGMARSALPSLLADGPSQQEQLMPDGRTLSLWRAPMPDGGALMTLADISKRRQQEIQIQGLLDELQAIFENAYVGIVHLKDRVFVNCNSQMAKMFGWESPQELIGQASERIYANHDE